MIEEYAGIGRHLGSIAKRTKACCKCGKKGKFGVWGNYYCKECFINYMGKDPDEIAEEGGKGNSGMIPLRPEKLEEVLNQKMIYPQSHTRPQLIYVPKGDKIFCSLFLTHYPQSKGIVGRTINYLIIWKERIVGIIGGNSAPYSVKPIDEYFGITKENRSDKLLGLFNNEVFRIISPDKNLATMVLREFRKRIRIDYKNKYGQELYGLITFVEPPRNGSIYKADNWIYLGNTQGWGTTRRGRRWFDRRWVKKIPKLIFVYKYKGHLPKNNTKINNNERKLYKQATLI